MQTQELERNLMMFCGSEKFYRHPLTRQYIYTEGVKFLADNAGAYWLIDAIVSYRRKEEFQVWVLKVKNESAVLTMQEDTSLGWPALVTQEIPYTDFPLSEMKLYCQNNGQGFTIFLPSEY